MNGPDAAARADFIRLHARLSAPPLLPELRFWLAEEATDLWEASEAFLEEVGLKCTVAFDPEGVVADIYGVEGIPHSVIVGKDGIVKAVHSGIAPDFKEMLEAELDAVIAGKTPGE